MQKIVMLILSLFSSVSLFSQPIIKPVIENYKDWGYRISNYKPGELKLGKDIDIAYQCSFENSRYYKFIKENDTDLAFGGVEKSVQLKTLSVNLKIGKTDTIYNDYMFNVTESIYEFTAAKVLEIKSILDLLDFPSDLADKKAEMQKTVKTLKYPVTLKWFVKSGINGWPFKYSYELIKQEGSLQNDNIGINTFPRTYYTMENDSSNIGVVLPFLTDEQISSPVIRSIWYYDMMSLDIIEHRLDADIKTTLLISLENPVASVILQNLGLKINCERIKIKTIK